MDGVLIDNFKPWLEFDRKFLSQFSAVPDDAYIQYVNGRSEEEVIHWAKKRFNMAQSEEEIMASRQDGVRKIYEIYSQPMPGAERLMEKIKANGFLLALVSGAKMWQIEIIIRRFKWKNFFRAIVSSDHVGYKGKPNPEIYLQAVKLLKLEPKNCLAVEDAENGVISAKRAGMKCIGFKNMHINENLSQSDFIIDSFADQKLIEFLGI